MGRPFEFNREDALEKAMKVFWEKGYKATSIQDLVDRMEIKRGSIYNTFGDKHSLFIQAVKHYSEVITSEALKILESPGCALDNINSFFDNIINSKGYNESRGCLLSNSVIEIVPHDPKAAEVINDVLKRIEQSFKRCLDKAVNNKEISNTIDTSSMARFFATGVHGLNVLCKSNINKKNMKDVVNIMVSPLQR